MVNDSNGLIMSIKCLMCNIKFAIVCVLVCLRVCVYAMRSKSVHEMMMMRVCVCMRGGGEREGGDGTIYKDNNHWFICSNVITRKQ